MTERIRIDALMQRTGVQFGTSGARGLAHSMTNGLCHAYTSGFLSFLEEQKELNKNGEFVAVAGDLRPSTGRIMEAIAQAVHDKGYNPVNCGRIPTPAVALYGFDQRIPSIMVTGSHIPADRNGIKFNKCCGEILKDDESYIMEQVVDYQENIKVSALFDKNNQPIDNYIKRYIELFPSDCLSGLRIGVYQHSAVGREVIVHILKELGAQTITLGFSDNFIPVDTEAIRDEDVDLAKKWSQEYNLDSIVTTDGDSDRPLISDENGHWLRGDLVGILVARFLGAKSIHTPISSNTALEKCEWFSDINRTKIGSPYVISSMQEAEQREQTKVVGYEANGGFLVQSDFNLYGKKITSLPTRDAILPILSILVSAAKNKKTISECVDMLPARFTVSDRIQNFPREKSMMLIDQFQNHSEIEKVFGELFGRISKIDQTDGLRITFNSEDILHIRPSGNAPEFRCYNESGSLERALYMQKKAMEKLNTLKD